MPALIALILALGISAPVAAAVDPRDEPDPELRAALMAAVNAADSFEHRFDAEVWLMDMSQRLARFMPDEAERLEFLRMVHAEARRADLPAELVLAVIQVESAFERFAISTAGAQGMMQIMPFWVREIGRPDDNLFDVATNLRYGCTILRHYLDRSNGRLIEALARYNGSYGQTWYSRRVLDALHQRWYRE